ncbi:phosphoribosylamine--glycine ligase [Patescibacteria group bacterium]|nr:phosphoribosylamine--glycine ligase [Patescibacteria group bacterium]
MKIANHKLKILIVGSGGREHALGWKLSQSPLVDRIFFAPGNAGTSTVGENVAIGVNEIGRLAEFAEKQQVDLTMVGPELPLTLGIVDEFNKKNLAIVGPTKKASRIESSKIFAKKLMKKYRIPTAEFAAFDDKKSALAYIGKSRFPVVVKADGLYAGKGVAVCSNFAQAKSFVEKLTGKIVVEECLVGPEVSFMVATDGVNFQSFLPSQDHKRLNDNDQGPNTGGMGAYAPVPIASQKLIGRIEKEIVAPIIKAMKKEGCLYQGILYPGLILTKDGPKVLEFNCRFGDPETQPLMTMLKSDLLPILLSIVKGTADKQKIIFKPGASVCVVLAAPGYPGKYAKNLPINGLNDYKDVAVFHAGTGFKDKKILAMGGRVLGITSYGRSIKEAIKKAYGVIGRKGVWFRGMVYRQDIAHKAIKNL